MKIRQVYFDLNGTLFDPSAMAEPLGGAGAEELVREILSEAILLSMAETLSGSYRDFAELLRAAAARRLALVEKEDRVDDVVSAARRMQPFPDAGQAISTLRAADIGAGVLTNSSTESARTLVAGAGLDLQPIVGTDQVEAFKPDRRVYERGAAAAGWAVDETALITAHGWDAIGAKRAGMLAVWVSRKERVAPRIDLGPDLEAESLAQAAELAVAARA